MSNRLTSYFWPAVSGILIAALVWLLAPEMFGRKPNNDSDDFANLREDGLHGPVSYSDAVSSAAPAVVNIYTTKQVVVPQRNLGGYPSFRGLFNRDSQLESSVQEQTSQGTGVVISREGYIVTNEHVIEDADGILVILQDGRQSIPEVVGRDRETDLAVLKIDLDNLAAINIGDPNAAEVGDVVLAIGNAYGFGHTVTQGILSATGRSLRIGDYVNFLQTDAAINKGNSGGPLVDIYGNMIGINSRNILDGSSVGLGFAIPTDIALKVVRDLVEHGKVIRGWLGVEARQLVGRSAESYGLDAAMMVTRLFPGGPAHRAGLEIEDIILRVDGEDIGDGRAVINKIRNAVPGNTLVFDILRDGQEISVTAQVEERPQTAN